MAVEKTKPMTLDDMKQLLSLMRESGAHSFSYNGLSVQFDLHFKTADQKAPPLTIDDKQAQSDELRQMLKQANEDESLNLTWST